MRYCWGTLLAGVVLMGLVVGCDRQPGSVGATDDHERIEAEAGHDEADEHDEHGALRLEPEAIAEHGLELTVAGPGELEITTELPGEVQVNGDRMAHVAPQVGGVVREVRVSLGDAVREGELLAVLESRELAEAHATFLAARERVSLAEATFAREERLFKEKVSAQQDFLDAQNALAEARIEQRAAEQQLRALGLDRDDLKRAEQDPEAALTQHRITAPFDGVVIDRHLTLGETVEAGRAVFTVADLSTVWIDLQVYQKDLGAVRGGQEVRLVTNHGTEAHEVVTFVQPLVGEATRTALARIVASNSAGIWHPGCFVTAHVTTAREQVAILVPRSALIRLEDGDSVVFVQDEHGLEPQPVELGRGNRDFVEVTGGLNLGTRYVARGAFSLKAELGKGSFGHGHAH